MTLSRRQFCASAGAFVAARASAKLAPANAAGVSMGHLHVNTNDLAAHKKFWTLLGAEPVKLGPMEGMSILNVLIFFKKTEPTGGTEGSTVNHVGFKIPDVQGHRAKLTTAGFKLLTPHAESLQTHKSNVLGPDGINVELVEDTSLTVPIVNHHVHFFNSPVAETKAWYVKTFSAIPGRRGKFEAADLPGVNLSFSPSPTAPAPTKGRVLDHIGFEVRNLEAFTRKLEASGTKFDVPLRKVPALGLSIAFFTDPWGTYIELTEGLNKV